MSNGSYMMLFPSYADCEHRAVGQEWKESFKGMNVPYGESLLPYKNTIVGKQTRHNVMMMGMHLLHIVHVYNRIASRLKD